MSSKAAEFMKFTVGMLDASAVFLKDKDSKTSTPTLVRDQKTPKEEKEVKERQKQEYNVDQTMQGFGQSFYGPNEVSPSFGNSSENAYPYEQEFAGAGFTPGPDTRQPWAGFADTVNFTAGDVQDWSLDRLYNFENIQGVEDILGNRRIIEEYDETGNNFAGF